MGGECGISVVCTNATNDLYTCVFNIPLSVDGLLMGLGKLCVCLCVTCHSMLRRCIHSLAYVYHCIINFLVYVNFYQLLCVIRVTALGHVEQSSYLTSDSTSFFNS